MIRAMDIGQEVLIAEDVENNTYAVRGIDPVSNRIWLCVTDPNYDGYNGDIIVSKCDPALGFTIVMRDGRCSLPSTITIQIKD